MKITAKQHSKGYFVAKSVDGAYSVSFAKKQRIFNTLEGAGYYNNLEAPLVELELTNGETIAFLMGKESAEYKAWLEVYKAQQAAIVAEHNAKAAAEYEQRRQWVLKLRALRANPEELLYSAELYWDNGEERYNESGGENQVFTTLEAAQKLYEAYKKQEPKVGFYNVATLKSFTVNQNWIADVTDTVTLQNCAWQEANDETIIEELRNDGEEMSADGFIIAWKWNGYPGGNYKLVDISRPNNYGSYPKQHLCDLATRGYESSFGTWEVYVPNLGEFPENYLPELVAKGLVTKEDMAEHWGQLAAEWHFAEEETEEA